MERSPLSGIVKESTMGRWNQRWILKYKLGRHFAWGRSKGKGLSGRNLTFTGLGLVKILVL